MRCLLAYILLLSLSLLITSCYKEEVSREKPWDVFELRVPDEMYQKIRESRDSTYSVNTLDNKLIYNGWNYEFRELRVRGRTARNFDRKSFAVHLNSTIILQDHSKTDFTVLKEFKLIAMAMDYTYIENRLGLGMLKNSGIMPLTFKYVELLINGDTQGLYFLLEDPEQYYRTQGSEYICRRGFHHNITDADYMSTLYSFKEEEYLARFNELYEKLPFLEGESLYNHINERLDLDQYFRKMGIDYLLKNGDYTDEIYLYTEISKGMPRFRIIPWDYDDLFSSRPHEIGNIHGVGKLFGERLYATMEEQAAILGDKLVYSIEDDLDYVIAIDSYLYEKYEETLSEMLDELDAQDIEELFQQIAQELQPFYFVNEIIAQSEYDNNPTSLNLWKNNMREKEAFLKDRLENMKSQLE